VTGAALGLGIGIAGSILVGKLIEDASKCKPQDVHPPAFGRYLLTPAIQIHIPYSLLLQVPP